MNKVKSVIKSEIKFYEKKIKKLEDQLERCNHFDRRRKIDIAIRETQATLNSLNSLLSHWEEVN